MSNLVEHAKVELELLGDEQWLTEGMLKIVQDFADMGHSGSSAAHTIAVLDRLLRFENLTSLTNDPKEWNLVGPDTWQCSRNPAAFSTDQGKTHYFISEGADPKEIQVSKSKDEVENF